MLIGFKTLAKQNVQEICAVCVCDVCLCIIIYMGMYIHTCVCVCVSDLLSRPPFRCTVEMNYNVLLKLITRGHEL